MTRPLAALLILLIGLTGCESRLDEPVEITPETKSAVEVLPADARFIGMADLQALKEHELGPFEGGFPPADLGGEHAARLRDFLDATGFDLEKDLRTAYAAMSEAGVPSLVLYADFSGERFRQYLDAQHTGDFEPSAYRGVTLYRHRDAEKPVAFALVNDNMILAAPEGKAVRAMIDRLHGQGAALESNAEAMQLIRQVQGRGAAWFVSRNVSTRVFEQAKLGQAGQLERAVQNAAASLNLTANGIDGQAFLTAQPGVSTGDLASVVRGLVAAARTSAKDNPQQMQTLDRVRVTERDGQVRIAFQVEREAARAPK